MDDFLWLNDLVMSNYSVYFLLQNNGLNVNCSVYSLTSGSLQWYDQYGWLDNITLWFLPAYYVTNCSMKGLRDQISSLSTNETDVLRWLEEFQNNPYNLADNGDLFVALLYMILGLCVLVWMLVFLFLLLPDHKRKPVLTQLATLVYLVVLTILLAQITEAVLDEYYADSLNMIKILRIVYSDKRYPITMIVLQALTCLAYVQLVVKMTKQRYKRMNAGLGIALVVLYLVVSSVAVAKVTNYSDFLSSYNKIFYLAFKVCSKLLFLIWFAVTLAYHTISGTASSPRQVAYLKRLAPLAAFTWAIWLLNAVVSILTITLWRHQWLVSSWIAFLPNLLEMYMLTSTWEWYYSIRHLEQKLELVGMLGRRISLDDVMSFSNTRHTRSTTLRGRFASFWCLLIGASPHSSDTKDLPANTSGSTAVALTPTPQNLQDYDTDLGQRHSEDSDGSYEVHFVDDDDLWDDHGVSDMNNDNENNDTNVPQEGASRDHRLDGNDELPPFQPHPGYSREDYWDEK